eukprot:m.253882 g.253882  ORF g.253882 m.253882 type:complete len:203 (+) comp19597_c0_seq1:72-680(+)
MHPSIHSLTSLSCDTCVRPTHPCGTTVFLLPMTGGVWMTMIDSQPIEFIPANATFVSAFESLEFKTDATRHKNGLFQAFIAVSPANPIMRRAMDLAVKLGRKSAHSDPAFFNTGGPNWGPYITWLALPPDNTWQDEAIYIYEEACNRKELLHRGGPGSACRCGVYDNNSTLLFKSHSSGSVNCAKEMAQPRPRGFFHWNPRT